jgi:hypothetical protein
MSAIETDSTGIAADAPAEAPEITPSELARNITERYLGGESSTIDPARDDSGESLAAADLTPRQLARQKTEAFLDRAELARLDEPEEFGDYADEAGLTPEQQARESEVEALLDHYDRTGDEDALDEALSMFGDDVEPGEAELGAVDERPWETVSEADWSAAVDAYNELYDHVAALEAERQQQAESGWDPLDDDAGEQLLGRVEALVENRLGRVEVGYAEAIAAQAHDAAWEQHVAEQAEIAEAELNEIEALEHARAERNAVLDSFTDIGPFNRERAYEWANVNLPVFLHRHHIDPAKVEAMQDGRVEPDEASRRAIDKAVREALHEGARLARPLKTGEAVNRRYAARERVMRQFSDENRRAAILRQPSSPVRADGSTMTPEAFARAKTLRYLAERGAV